jgi:hypothetical protein
MGRAVRVPFYVWVFEERELREGCWDVEVADAVDVFKVRFVVSVVDGVWGLLHHLVPLHVAEGAEFFDRHFTDERGCEVDDNICTYNVS